MCLKAREGARAGSPAAGAATPRNGPSRLRRDSAGPHGRPRPPHPPQPEPCAAATAAANTAAPAPDATRRLLAVGRAVGLRGRGHRPPPGSGHRRVPALRPRRAPARPPAPAGGRQLLQPPTAAASLLRALRAPGAFAQPQPQPQPPGRVLAQRLALAPPTLPSCFHMQYQPRTRAAAAFQKTLPPSQMYPSIGCPLLGQPLQGPLYLPFPFLPGWGK